MVSKNFGNFSAAELVEKFSFDFFGHTKKNEYKMILLDEIKIHDRLLESFIEEDFLDQNFITGEFFV